MWNAHLELYKSPGDEHFSFTYEYHLMSKLWYTNCDDENFNFQLDFSLPVQLTSFWFLFFWTKRLCISGYFWKLLKLFRAL